MSFAARPAIRAVGRVTFANVARVELREHVLDLGNPPVVGTDGDQSAAAAYALRVSVCVVLRYTFLLQSAGKAANCTARYRAGSGTRSLSIVGINSATVG